MNGLTMAQPIWLFLGPLLVLTLVALFRFIDKRNRRDLDSFVSPGLGEEIRSSVSGRKRWAKRGCFLAGIFFLCTALARPQLGNEWREVRRKGIDILFALDSSRSMLARDVTPNRLERAKLGMLDFVEKLEGDRIGLLPFAGSSFLLCPLTLDYDAFRQSLEAVDTELIPKKGTDLAGAIREAAQTFEEAGNNHRILVIITDGEDLQGEALQAAGEAAETGLVIHTVGIGSSQGELVQLANGDYLKDGEGNLVRSKLDEKSLRAIAGASGGSFEPFGQQAEGLRQIYQKKLSLVPKEELTQRTQKIPTERFQWPMGAAVLCLLLYYLIDERRRSRRIRAVIASPVTTLILVSVMVLSQAGHGSEVLQSYNKGIALYQDGNYEAAMTSFERTIEETRDTRLQAKAYYNLGNTLFKEGAVKLGDGDLSGVIESWEKSLAAFDGALALEPTDGDATFNRKLVEEKLDELKNQQDQKEQGSDSKEEDSKDQQDQASDSKDEKRKDEKSGDEQPSDDSSRKDEVGKPADQDQEKTDSSRDGEQSEGKPEEEKQETGNDSRSDEVKPEENDSTEPDNQKNNEEPSSEKNVTDEKKEGSGTSTDPQNENKGGEKVGVGQERRKSGEMSKEEARQLLRALKNEEQKVLLAPARRGNPRAPENTTKGKDW